jgi:adenosine 3'-phospho 5'-phosphosulfate transporter B2
MPLPTPKAAGSLSSDHVRDTAGIVVVTLALLVYGVLQERIMTVGFGPEQAELFEFSIFLVLCNRLCTSIMAFIYVALTEPNISPAAPIRSYAAVSFTNVVATSCQYEALKYVSFAVQTLAKSAKAMPVMLWGTVYSGKRYRVVEYAHACVITLGCTIFILAGASRMHDRDLVGSLQRPCAHASQCVHAWGAHAADHALPTPAHPHYSHCA